AIANYMTLLGWSPPEGMSEIFSMAEAAQKFGFERVNKAGAKFDWDKLNWLNSQYLHAMPIDQLTDLLIPYWQAAGYEFDLQDRAWLEQLTALLAASLVRLDDAVAMSKYLFVADVGFTEEATVQLKQDNVATVLQGIIAALEATPTVTEANVQEVIQAGVKAAGVKKGVAMRSLRAALTGDMHGPDLVQSWLLLNQHHLDLPRLKQALAVSLG
ncbi:MAG TPA: glutamate--tRNA ligase, partial [Coleofasciculaceae cyanobacterium]